jgi:hypothetical protein
MKSFTSLTQTSLPKPLLQGIASLLILHTFLTHLYAAYLYATPERPVVVQAILIPIVNKTVVTLEPSIEIKEQKLQVVKKYETLTEGQERRIQERLDGLIVDGNESFQKVSVKLEDKVKELKEMELQVSALMLNLKEQVHALEEASSSIPHAAEDTEENKASLDPHALEQIQSLLSLHTYVNYESTSDLAHEIKSAQDTLQSIVDNPTTTMVQSLFSSLPTQKITNTPSCDDKFLLKSRPENDVNQDDDDALLDDNGEEYASERDLRDLTQELQSGIETYFHNNLESGAMDQTLEASVLEHILTDVKKEVSKQGQELEKSLNRLTIEFKEFVEEKQAQIDAYDPMEAIPTDEEIDSTCVTVDQVEEMIEYGLEMTSRGYELQESLVEIVQELIQEDLKEGDLKQLPTSTSSPQDTNPPSTWVYSKTVWSMVDNAMIPTLIQKIDEGVEAISGYSELVDGIIDYVIGEEGDEESVGKVLERNFKSVLGQIHLPQEWFDMKEKAGILSGNM